MQHHKQSKPWYAKWWVWVLVILVLIGIGGASSNTNTTQNASEPAPATQTTTKQSEPKPAEKKWDIKENYEKIQNGMTKAEVEAAINKTSDNCSESTTEYVGKMEICSYGSFGDKGIITVTYSEDKVTAKAKNEY